MRKKTLLVITDGIGYSEKKNANAFFSAKKPTYEYLLATVPHSLLHTYGKSVGLPDGQMGNSEVGHMTIGSGRILYQDLVKISLSLENGSLAQNESLRHFFASCANIHIAGLVSDGGVHSHIDHILGIAKIARTYGKKVYLHAITDGRDVSPTSATHYIQQLCAICDDSIKLASISGRFYAMDRDNRWERIQKAYNAMVNAYPHTDISALEYINTAYENGITDEFIEPVSFIDASEVHPNDGFFFANFRADRARQIVMALGNEHFDAFERSTHFSHLATMTPYAANLPFPALFSKEEPKNTLAQIISEANLRQFHTAETEKYAHVTFFFNGGVETPFLNETRVLIPSPKVKTYDEKPQMSAKEVCSAVLKAMDEAYEFIVVNFANGDMVGHTGVFEAAVKAVECVDECLGEILQGAKANEYALVITSDHGNCEEMKDDDGHILTNHTVGDVYCFVVDEAVNVVENGGLNNIAPTILTLMGLTIPPEMDKPLITLKR